MYQDLADTYDIWNHNAKNYRPDKYVANQLQI